MVRNSKSRILSSSSQENTPSNEYSLIDTSEADRQIEDLYARALCQQLGIDIGGNSSQHEASTSRVRETPYKGDLAFALSVHCITPDVPPPGTQNFKHTNSCVERCYQIKIIGLDHDTAMLLLTSMKDAFPLDVCMKVMSPHSFGTKRGKSSKELTALGIPHMGKWITANRNGTYTIHIRHIVSKQMRRISKILFEW